MNYLFDSFKEYLEIFNNSKGDEIVLDSCDAFTPTSTLPLVNFIRMNTKSIRQHENPRVNSYLWEALHIKKPYGNSFYPICWVDDVNDNSEWELNKFCFKFKIKPY